MSQVCAVLLQNSIHHISLYKWKNRIRVHRHVVQTKKDLTKLTVVMFGGKIMKWIWGDLSMLKLSRMIKHHLDNKTDKESIIKLIRQTFLLPGPCYVIYTANVWQCCFLGSPYCLNFSQGLKSNNQEIYLGTSLVVQWFV